MVHRFHLQRIFLKLTALSVLLALFAMPGMRWIKSIQPTQAAKILAVEAIQTGHSIEICSHHPLGCPKECKCPKTSVGHASNPDSNPDRLDQPYFAQCVEHGSLESPMEVGVFLNSNAILLDLIVWENPMEFGNSAKPLSPCLEPTEKIPRV